MPTPASVCRGNLNFSTVGAWNHVVGNVGLSYQGLALASACSFIARNNHSYFPVVSFAYPNLFEIQLLALSHYFIKPFGV